MRIAFLRRFSLSLNMFSSNIRLCLQIKADFFFFFFFLYKNMLRDNEKIPIVPQHV